MNITTNPLGIVSAMPVPSSAQQKGGAGTNLARAEAHAAQAEAAQLAYQRHSDAALRSYEAIKEHTSAATSLFRQHQTDTQPCPTSSNTSATSRG